jgi:hypothetical protein
MANTGPTRSRLESTPTLETRHTFPLLPRGRSFLQAGRLVRADPRPDSKMGTPIDREKLLSIGIVRRSAETRRRDRQEAREDEVATSRTIDGVPIRQGQLRELAEEYAKEHN